MKRSVLISLVLIALGAGMVAYAKCAASSSDSVPAKVEQRLREKAQAGKAYCDKNGYNTNYCFLVDFSIHSGKRRFFVWDFKGDSVKYASLCAHGYGKIALCPSLYSAMWKVAIALRWGNTRWVSGRIASGESIFIINYMDWKRRIIMLSSGISCCILILHCRKQRYILCIFR